MAVTLTNQDEGIAGFAFINDGSGATGWHFTNIAYGFGATQTDILTPNEVCSRPGCLVSFGWAKRVNSHRSAPIL
jgi:hypothetical protein